MQSYEHHVVHESLEMRHPYIQDPFSSEIEPSQVSCLLPLNYSFCLCIDHNSRLRQDDLKVQGSAP